MEYTNNEQRDNTESTPGNARFLEWLRRGGFIAALVVMLGGAVAAILPSVRVALIALAETNVLHRPSADSEFLPRELLRLSILLTIIGGSFAFILSKKFQVLYDYIKSKPVIPVLVIGFLLILFAVRVSILSQTSEGIWADEAFSAFVLPMSFRDILVTQSHDVHPPLYFILLKLWSLVFGTSVGALKAFSVIPTVLALSAGAVFLTREFSAKAAVIFLLACMTSERIIHNAFEIRMYSLAFFFVTAAAIAVWYIIKSGHLSAYIEFLLCALGAAYTNYFSGAMIGGGFCLLFCYVAFYQRWKIKRMLYIAGGGILLYLPWLPFVFRKFGAVNADGFWIPPLGVSDIVLGVWEIFRCGGVFIESFGKVFFTRFSMLCFLAVLLYFLFKKAKTKFGKFLFLANFSWGGVGAVSIVFSLIFHPMFTARYLFPGYALAWLFFGAALAMVKYRRLVAAVGVLYFVFGTMLYSDLLCEEKKEDVGYKKMELYFSQHLKPSDCIVVLHSDDLRFGSPVFELATYLFPRNQFFADKRTHEKQFYEIYLNKNPGQCHSLREFVGIKNQRTWLLCPVLRAPENSMPRPEFLRVAKYHGEFSWYFYRFQVYFTETPDKLFPLLEKEIKK